MLNQTPKCLSVNEISDCLSKDEWNDKVLFVQKVEQGIKDSITKNVYSKEEAKSKLSKWLK